MSDEAVVRVSSSKPRHPAWMTGVLARTADLNRQIKAENQGRPTIKVPTSEAQAIERLKLLKGQGALK